jgi:uncharacterized protein (TIGR02597 family)
MMHIWKSFGIIGCCWVALNSLRADSMSFTPAAGYFLLNIRGNSDSYVSFPLVQRVASVGKISGVRSNQIVVGSKIWEPGHFRAVAAQATEPPYYAEFASGALRGVRYRVLDNSDDTLVLDTEGDDLTAHPLGAVGFNDIVRLRPLWTVGGVFGSSESDLKLDPKPNPMIPADAVILPDNTEIGQNKAPNMELAFVRGTGWRSSDDLDNDQQHRPFEPTSPMIIRRRNPAGVTLVLLGRVLTGPQAAYVVGGNGLIGNDAYVSLVTPEPVSLSTAGLADPANPTASVIRGSNSILLRGDELLSFGAGTGFNLSPERSFFYLNNTGWREFGTDNGDVGSGFFLEPGKAYIVRKRASNPGVDWIQNKGN